MTAPSFQALLADRRIVVVVRHDDQRAAEAIARAVVEGGLRAVEITTAVSGAPELIATLRATLEPAVLVGAGTVLSASQADDVLGAGAQFVVSPGLDSGVFERCAAAQVAILPGVLTPTEVMACRALGLDAVKLFPSDTGGPPHLRALRSVFTDVAFVPTGGVTSANAAGWLDAGALALGLAGEVGAAFRAGGSDAVRRLAEHLSTSFETVNGTRSVSGATT
jgi:2-dehydro-3-deoxyphosphogluconate aldolase / (4S)-4-hydroxy-2-oxoglutarate aldolase